MKSNAQTSIVAKTQQVVRSFVMTPVATPGLGAGVDYQTSG